MAERQTPASRRTQPLTIGQAMRLPTSVDLMTAARALRLSRNKAYKLAKADEFPCRVIRIGDMWRVPTAELLAVLGIGLTALSDADGAGPRRQMSGDDDA